jgi:hypothetical protein
MQWEATRHERSRFGPGAQRQCLEDGRLKGDLSELILRRVRSKEKAGIVQITVSLHECLELGTDIDERRMA